MKYDVAWLHYSTIMKEGMSLQRNHMAQQTESIDFRHAAAESTGMADASVDLVSCSLVLHELPQVATSALLQETFRVLRPGGLLAIMVLRLSVLAGCILMSWEMQWVCQVF